MSEDEEVVFEGHELHHYLCQQGFTDFEVVKYSSPLQDSKTKKSETLRQQLWTLFKGAIQPFLPKWWTPDMKKLAPLQLEVEVILNSGLLLEDDSHFLENLALPIDVISTKPLWTELTLLHGMLVCGTMFMWKKEVIHGLFPFFHFLLAAEHFLSNWYFSLQRIRMSRAVKRLLTCCKDLYVLQKKSLHFVQENELLFRGFTLTKAPSSALRVESSPIPCLTKRWYVMSGLRVSISHSAFKAINVLQNATQTLVMMCPLSGHLDKRNHYLAYLSAEDMGIEGPDTAENTELPLEILKGK